MNSITPMEPVLACRSLAKSFPSGGRQVEVLREVSLSLHAGQSLSIRGESGCGKTTLLNILASLEAADRGTLLWEGAEVSPSLGSRVAAKRASFLGMVFQNYYLVPELDATQNVLLAARILGQPMEEARPRAADLLHQVGLDHRTRALPATLSGGERQRVALARALINRPSVLLADEPTGNLDERTAEAVMDLLLQVCRDSRTALILVTHNPGFAARTEHQALLHEGSLNHLGGEDSSPG